MIQKRNAAILIAIFAAIGLVTATGAFTTVTAERTATVSTAGDSSALLALTPHDGPNGDHYAAETNGTLELHLDGSANQDSTAAGVNLNALTEVNNVFIITNQGTQQVNVWISKSGDNPDAVVFYNGPNDDSNRVTIDVEDNAKTLDTGESMNVSLDISTIDTEIEESDGLIDGITVYANATSP